MEVLLIFCFVSCVLCVLFICISAFVLAFHGQAFQIPNNNYTQSKHVWMLCHQEDSQVFFKTAI